MRAQQSSRAPAHAGGRMLGETRGCALRDPEAGPSGDPWRSLDLWRGAGGDFGNSRLSGSGWRSVVCGAGMECGGPWHGVGPWRGGGKATCPLPHPLRCLEWGNREHPRHRQAGWHHPHAPPWGCSSAWKQWDHLQDHDPSTSPELRGAGRRHHPQVEGSDPSQPALSSSDKGIIPREDPSADLTLKIEVGWGFVGWGFGKWGFGGRGLPFAAKRRC